MQIKKKKESRKMTMQRGRLINAYSSSYGKESRARRREERKTLAKRKEYVESLKDIKNLENLHSFAEFLYFKDVPILCGDEYLTNGKPSLILTRKPTQEEQAILEEYGLQYAPHHDNYKKRTSVIHRVIPIGD